VAKISDNNIRIPSTDPLIPAFAELAKDYQCLQSADQCLEITQAQAKQKLIDTYSESVSTFLPQMNFPVSDNQTYYSVSSTDPDQKKTALQICEDNTDVLIDRALMMIQKKGSAQIEQVLLTLHDAVYWARRAGKSDQWIQSKLAEVQSTLVQDLEERYPKQEVIAPLLSDNPPAPEPDQITKSDLELTPPTTSDHTDKKDATFYLRALGSKNSLKEIPEVPDLITHYQMIDLAAGYRFHLSKDDVDFLTNSGPMIEANASLVTGAPENQGSHRTQIDLRAGWQQRLMTAPLPNRGSLATDISATTGIGTAFNSLSFGNGYIDPHKNSLMSSSQASIDFDYCLPDANHCLGISGGYFYERTLLGLPDYHNSGLIFGLNYTSDIDWPNFK
jgi:hypothetical protein